MNTDGDVSGTKAVMGKPLVATPWGAEGLVLQDGREIILQDDPRAFADAIADLPLHPEQRQEHQHGRARTRPAGLQFSICPAWSAWLLEVGCRHRTVHP